MGKGHETPITERFVKPSFAPSDNPRTPRKGRNPGNHEGFGLFFSPMEPRKTVCATRDALLQEWRKPRLAGLSGTNDVLRHSRSGLPPLLQGTSKNHHLSVIPAKAGIQCLWRQRLEDTGPPAFAGVTGYSRFPTRAIEQMGEFFEVP